MKVMPEHKDNLRHFRVWRVNDVELKRQLEAANSRKVAHYFMLDELDARIAEHEAIIKKLNEARREHINRYTLNRNG